MLLTRTTGFLFVFLAVAMCAAGQTAASPAWGDITSGLRVGLAVAEPGTGQLPELDVFFQNASDSGFLVNLGVMLGHAFEPRAVALSVTEQDGLPQTVRWARPFFVAGRLDDLPVALRPGATYSMRVILAEFLGRTTSEHELRLRPGRYRLRILFEGRRAVFLNSGMEGVELLHWWVGRTESGSVEVNVGQ